MQAIIIILCLGKSISYSLDLCFSCKIFYCNGFNFDGQVPFSVKRKSNKKDRSRTFISLRLAFDYLSRGPSDSLELVNMQEKNFYFLAFLLSFAFDYLKFASVNSLKIFTLCEIYPANHLEAKKIGVSKAVSSLFAIFCFLRLAQIWWYELFLSTGTRKCTNIFFGPENLRKFHRRKGEKSWSKHP